MTTVMSVEYLEERLKGLQEERRMVEFQIANTEENTLTLKSRLAWVDSKIMSVRGHIAHSNT